MMTNKLKKLMTPSDKISLNKIAILITAGAIGGFGLYWVQHVNTAHAFECAENTGVHIGKIVSVEIESGDLPEVASEFPSCIYVRGDETGPEDEYSGLLAGIGRQQNREFWIDITAK